MNIKKRFSVLLIPHHPGKIMEKKISVNLLVVIMVGLFLIISTGLFFFLGAGGRAYDQVRFYQLKKENSYLHAKLNEFNTAAEELKVQMADLIEKEKKVRMVFGLPQVDEQIRGLGVGGPSPYNPTDLDTKLGQVRATEIEVDRLLRQARFEKDNFDQIYFLLSEKKEILNHTPSIRPSGGYLSCGFGMRTDPFTGRSELHRGVDLAADIGTPVYVTADGVISEVSRDVGLGKLVRVDHRHGYSTIYAHLSRIAVKLGQQVKRGDLVGAVGNTGYSTGPHLHYEVYLYGQAQNPIKYFLGDHLAVD